MPHIARLRARATAKHKTMKIQRIRDSRNHGSNTSWMYTLTVTYNGSSIMTRSSRYCDGTVVVYESTRIIRLAAREFHKHAPQSRLHRANL